MSFHDTPSNVQAQRKQSPSTKIDRRQTVEISLDELAIPIPKLERGQLNDPAIRTRVIDTCLAQFEAAVQTSILKTVIARPNVRQISFVGSGCMSARAIGRDFAQSLRLPIKIKGPILI